MWIASTLGFFSVVRSSLDNRFMIRARRKADLRNLLEAGLTGELLDTPDADYVAQLLVEPDELPRSYALLAMQVDYANFKGRIHDLPDQAGKSRMYGKMWSAAYEYQQKIGRHEPDLQQWVEAITPDEVKSVDRDYQRLAYEHWKQLNPDG